MPSGKPLKLLDSAERLSLGRQARTRVARSKVGLLEAKKRAFDPIQVLEKAARNRVRRLLPVKYKRMAASPFAFFRGAVSIMAADFASQPHSGLAVQLCGDAHVQNLGSFETPDGRIVFDINDFDETIAGPWEWDVKRMAASIFLAGAESDHNKTASRSAAADFAASYIETLRALAEEPILVAARYQIRRIEKASAISAALIQAERAKPVDLLEKYAEKGARGQVRFRELEGILWRLDSARKREVLKSLTLYRESLPPERLHLFDFFRPLDVAFKIVGTGSVGLRDYVVLMLGNGKEDPLFLQIKQEVESAYSPYLKGQKYLNQGLRVAEGQRKIQPISDLLLGWTTIGEEHFLVRQLNDHKGRVDLANLSGTGLNELAKIAGQLLARGHARSGDALAMAGYIGKSDRVMESIIEFGERYAALTEADFALFQKALKSRRLKASA